MINSSTIKYCRIISASFFLIVLISPIQVAKAQSPTRNQNFKLTSWNVVNSSLTDLLNSGWKIVGTSSHRVATVTGRGIGAIDEETYVYTVSKDGKYINCSFTDPVANKGAYTACRLLN
jgi:hypothetical protein